MPDASASITSSNIFRQLASAHQNLEAWHDADFNEGGFDYFWICTVTPHEDGPSVRNLAYVRTKPGLIQKRTYDENGDDLWIDVD